MLQRHRIPTIFSIYMVDVLCCALGCVVLLWQVNHQEAEERTAAAASSLYDLGKANERIAALAGELEYVRASLDASHKKYLAVSVELDKTKKDRDDHVQLALVRKQEYDLLTKNHRAAEALLARSKLDLKDLQSKSAVTAAQLADQLKAFATAEALILSLKVEVKDLQAKSTLTAAQLLDKLKANAELLAKIAKSEARVVILEKDLDARKLELLLAGKKADDQSAKLKAADLRMSRLDKQLVELTAEAKDALARLKIADLRGKLLEQNADRGQTDLSDAKRRLQLLTADHDALSKRLLLSAKDLADARAQVASLQGERLSLMNRTKNMQAAMENRFAGVTLTGKNVIFLIDMSGSMELLDATIIDPDKWPLVCETLARILRSLTDVQRFQVILFSERIIYPLRNEGRWIDYTGPEMAKDVAAAVKAIKPKGGTDVYAGMAEAFRFRPLGLDTIYFISDGLPGMGEGLPPNAEKLTESQVTEALSKHVRQKLKTDWNRYSAGRPRVRINSIGFFFESPDVGAFLWALSREHDGSFVGMSK
ncbi:MAG: VWA domain-containing protein [Gemmataceae bacterium]|nr:VWA domain-containing protein [Gemmataceae bacterium]